MSDTYRSLPLNTDDHARTDLECLYDASKGLYLITCMVKSVLSSDGDGSLLLDADQEETLNLVGSAVMMCGIQVENMLHSHGLCLLLDTDIADLPLPLSETSIHNEQQKRGK